MRARLTSDRHALAGIHIAEFARCLSARVAEVLAICGRALAAAHAYEQLKPMSDEALASHGLKRTDLARAVFHKLTRAK